MKHFYITLIIVLGIQILFFQIPKYSLKNELKYQQKYQNGDSVLKKWKDENIRILVTVKFSYIILFLENYYYVRNFALKTNLNYFLWKRKSL
ncbi:MAG: hypothetical protein EAZ85_03125 [Bacteroidetes bacterium]|nr:MAG: hypothetical protein EAZ85_03125 [Bacteroidota bacterium]